MANTIKVELTGFEDTFRRLRLYPKSVGKKALRKGMIAAGKLVRTAARQNIEHNITKLLYKSLGWKVKAYSSTGTIVVLVGPRTKGFKRQIGVWSSGKHAGEPAFRNPIKYAHLVEKGTYRTQAKPFLRPAFEQNKDAIVQAVKLAILSELIRS